MHRNSKSKMFPSCAPATGHSFAAPRSFAALVSTLVLSASVVSACAQGMTAEEKAARGDGDGDDGSDIKVIVSDDDDLLGIWGMGGTSSTADCVADEECDDGSECTVDSCDGGTCAFVAGADCSCLAATDCDDLDECTTDACTGEMCSNTPIENCGVPLEGLILRSMRGGETTGQYISLNPTGVLMWNLTAMEANASRFEKVAISETDFQLLEVGTGKYVVLGANNQLQATADLAAALVFQTPDCGMMGTALKVAASETYFKAEGDGRLVASATGCNIDSTTAWERFELK